MSVLHDVLNKMMTDFLIKEDAWKACVSVDDNDGSRRRGSGPVPEPFALTLDSPDFRQLIKDLNESVQTIGPAGLTYRRRFVDGVPYVAPDIADENLRARPSISVCYPYPAGTYIYAATVRHNCTLAASAPPVSPFPDLSFLRGAVVRGDTPRQTARDLFLAENAAMIRNLVPDSDRPGYVDGSCACVDCRFSSFMSQPLQDGDTIRFSASDGLREQDRNRLAGMEMRPAVVDEWSTAYQAMVVGPGMTQWLVEPSPPEAASPYPAPAPPSHPNDPRPRMPRLNDGQPSRGVTLAGTIEAVRRICTGRTRL